MGRVMTSQLESEVMHYRREALRGSAATGCPIPPPPLSVSRHRSGSRCPPVGGSRAASQASSGGSVRQPAQPPVAPPSAPNGEGENAP